MSSRMPSPAYPALTVAIVRGLRTIYVVGKTERSYTVRERRDALLAMKYVKKLVAAYERDGRL